MYNYKAILVIHVYYRMPIPIKSTFNQSINQSINL